MNALIDQLKKNGVKDDNTGNGDKNIKQWRQNNVKSYCFLFSLTKMESYSQRSLRSHANLKIS